jgi:hypothetical protein
LRDDGANLANVPANVTRGLIPSNPRCSVNSAGAQGKDSNERGEREELHEAVFESYTGRCYLEQCEVGLVAVVVTIQQQNTIDFIPGRTGRNIRNAGFKVE